VSPDVDKRQGEHAGAEARGAELREELAITDERRAEEEEANAEQAVADAVKEESEKERERREAEERRRAAAAEAERARERAEPLRPPPGPAHPTAVEGPERPELHVAAAFAGAFLFARILKKIAE
jgi:hypothetical protein